MAVENPGLRLSIVGIVAISLFAALFVRMYTLQVVQRSDFQQVATNNRTRTVHEQAPRGRILDMHQNVLVDSKEVFQVTADVRQLPTKEADRAAHDRILAIVAAQLTTQDHPVSVADLDYALDHNLVDTFAPVPLVTDISEDAMVGLMERQDELPGISVRRTTVRQYNYGTLAAHVLGYVQSISQEKLDQIDEDTHGENPLDYESGDEIGTSGIEKAYEDVLRGTPGYTEYEVDARGTIVRTLDHVDPVPGHDVITTLDVNLQSLAESQLKAIMDSTESIHPDAGGSVVVLDPNNGEVRALASYPTFSPTEFVDGISQEAYSLLKDPNGPQPLFDRAVAGQYAPGSTFKPVTALAGIANGVRTPADTVNDTGEYRAEGCEGDSGCVFHNDEPSGNGAVNLPRSLTVSSDYYYYQIGDLLWLHRDQIGDHALQDVAEDFGFGHSTGIELSEELPGVVPTPELMAQNFREHPDVFERGDWHSGDNINLSIGQGDLLVTPLQLANAYAALANGGTLWRPHLAIAEGEPVAGGIQAEHRYEPHILGHYALTPDIRQPLLDGLVGVTQSAEGTAHGAFSNNPAGFVVAGKTGTAQRAGHANTSVFVGFGPVTPDQPPQYVAAAILEEAGYGADAAAPLIARLFAGIADPTQMPVALTAADVLGDAVPANSTAAAG